MPAAAFVQNHTSGEGTTAPAATLVANVPARNVLVAWVSADNTSATAPVVSSISTPGGETASWVKIAQHDSSVATSASGVRGEMWAIKTTVQWASGFTPTVTFGSAPNTKSCISLKEFSSVLTTLRGTAGTGTSTTGVPTASSAGVVPVAGDLALGAASWETSTAPTSGDSDTTGGSWSTPLLIASATGGATAAQIRSLFQHKIMTGTTAQTYNPPAPNSTDSGAAVVILQQDPVVPGTATGLLGFDAPASGTVIPPVTGTATGDLGFNAPAVGTIPTGGANVTGTATGDLGFSAPAAGERTVTGTATGDLGFNAPAIGVPAKTGLATGLLGFDAPAVGSKIVTGVATGNLGFTAPAAGTGSIPNSKIWFRAESLAGLADGTAIDAQWASVAGTSSSSQPTSTKRPTKQTVNGRTVVRFDNVDDFLFLDGDALTWSQNIAGATIFLKVRLTGSVGGATEGILGFGTSTSPGTRLLIRALPTPVWNFGGRRLAADGFVSVGTTAWTVGQVTVLTAIADWANTDAFLFVDGVAAGSSTTWLTAGNTENNPSFAATIGASPDQTNPAPVDVYDVIVYDSATTDRAQIEAFLAGAAPVTGTATGVLGFSAPATGSKIVTGTATGDLGFSAPAAGVPVKVGTATGLLGFSAPAVGSKIVTGQATGLLGFSAPAVGTPVAPGVVTGTATGLLGFSAPAIGVPAKVGVATGLLGFSAPAIGAVVAGNVVTGLATGLLGFDAPAAGSAASRYITVDIVVGPDRYSIEAGPDRYSIDAGADRYRVEVS